jgi:hypothetical protein
MTKDTHPEQRVVINEGTLKKNQNLAPATPRPPAPKAQVAPSAPKTQAAAPASSPKPQAASPPSAPKPHSPQPSHATPRKP